MGVMLEFPCINRTSVMTILLDIGFRFAAMALLGILATLVVRRGRRHPSESFALAFVAGLVSYLVLSGPMGAALPMWLQVALLAGALANPLLFWLLTRSIFEDGFRLRLQHGVVLLVVETLGFLSVLAREGQRDAMPWAGLDVHAGTALRFISIALIVAAIVVAHGRGGAKLTDGHRKARVSFVSVVGAYMLVVVLSEILLGGVAPHPVASMLNAAVVLTIVAGVCVTVLAPRLGLLLEPVRPSPAGVELDFADQALVQRLEKAMSDRAYSREGLTIGQLADQLHTHEHRLRALINTRLGFRNFADFLNRHRIAEACERLSDPAQSDRSILTIGLDLGYGSIGPFNRAFKLETGLTPTQYRHGKLADRPESRPAGD